LNLRHFIDTIGGLFFPRICLNCNTRLTDKTPLCPECTNKLVFLNQYMTDQTNKIYDEVYIGLKYDRISRNLIHNLKYFERLSLAEFLISIIYEKIPDTFLANTDYISPIPLHRVKLRARGFNQAELISKQLCHISGIIHLKDLLIRSRFTKTQTKLSSTKRIENVKNAFLINTSYDIKGKSVILVDDVFTTGSTANEAARALKNAGAAQVKVFATAHSVH